MSLSVNDHRITADECTGLVQADDAERPELALAIVDRLRDGGADLSSDEAIHLIASARDAEATIAAIRKRPVAEVSGERTTQLGRKAPSFRVVNVLELLQAKLPPRELLLNPWLQTQGLVMVFAPRGVGKTHFALGVAYAMWTQGAFLGWTAKRPTRVLFLDGEMPASVLQERLRSIIDADDRQVEAQAESFRFITPDLLEGAPPDLSDIGDQVSLQTAIDEFNPEVIIADNISTLVRSSRAENDAESWLTVQEWALRMRQQGRCVIFVHHAGKGGAQRGTSKREDVLDTIIALRHPSDYSPEQGARFEVSFEKARHLHGAAARSFEAWLQAGPDGREHWSVRTLEDSTFDRVVRSARDGLSGKEIAQELGIHKSNVSRSLKRARETGLLPSDGTS